MGLTGNYAVPILVTALTLVGYALRERSSRFALAGGLVLNLGATTAYLLAISRAGLNLDAVTWLRLAQINALVAASYGLAWIGLVAWHRRRSGAQTDLAFDAPLAVQSALGPALWALVLAGLWARLLIAPHGVALQPPVPVELADWLGWTSLLLVVGSVLFLAGASGRKLGALATSALLTALVVFAGSIAARFDTGDWQTYSTLGIGHAVAAAVLLAIAFWQTDERRWSLLWVLAQLAAVLMLSLRIINEDQWWTVAGLGAVAHLSAKSAWVFRRGGWLWLAAPCIWLAVLLAVRRVVPGLDPDDFAYWSVIALALPVPLWLAIEIWRIRPATGGSVHRVATRLALFVLALTVVGGLYGDAFAQRLTGSSPLSFWALSAVALAALAGLWDARSRDAVALLYTVGLVAIGVLVDSFDLQPSWLLWTGTMVLAAYTLATSYLWSIRAALRKLAAAVRIPLSEARELAQHAWLVPVTVLLIGLVVAQSLLVLLHNPETGLRVLVSQATLSQVVSLALLARGDRRGLLQTVALALAVLGGTMFGWAWLQVGTTLTPINALVVVLASTALMSVFYGLGLTKLLRDTSDWLTPARRMVPWLAGVSLTAIVATLSVEAWEFTRTGEVRIAWPAIVVVAVTLIGLSMASLAAAVLPGRDPLGPERARQDSVRLWGRDHPGPGVHAHPVVDALAIPRILPAVLALDRDADRLPGRGRCELCRRRQLNVLAEPLTNTGALLPVLPVAGFWAIDSQVDYSLLLVGVGALYACLSVTRKSFGFGVLAALAANGGLWYFLNQQDGLGLLRHPQVWLIPPALCVLAAAYLNRRQLSESQMAAVRYGSSMVIYVSSTADIFLVGVRDAPWLPLVLAGLSLVGIAAGIVLRVRAFLFLGVAFLGLAMFTVIWYAAVDLEQTWIWYACGAAVGVLILIALGIAEKKGQQARELLERLKQWDA